MLWIFWCDSISRRIVANKRRGERIVIKIHAQYTQYTLKYFTLMYIVYTDIHTPQRFIHQPFIYTFYSMRPLAFQYNNLKRNNIIPFSHQIKAHLPHWQTSLSTAKILWLSTSAVVCDQQQQHWIHLYSVLVISCILHLL